MFLGLDSQYLENATSKMNAKLMIVLAVAAVAAADSRESFAYATPRDFSSESREAKYDFSWDIGDDSSSNEFQHHEQRQNDNTQGSYTVQLPDGRLQTVTYHVDGESGYVAQVSYDGEARYPDSSESREYVPVRPRQYFDSNESK